MTNANVTACHKLTITDYGTPLLLETRWAKRRPNGGIVTGLITSRGFMRWTHADTPCLTCGRPVADHLQEGA